MASSEKQTWRTVLLLRFLHLSLSKDAYHSGLLSSAAMQTSLSLAWRSSHSKKRMKRYKLYLVGSPGQMCNVRLRNVVSWQHLVITYREQHCSLLSILLMNTDVKMKRFHASNLACLNLLSTIIYRSADTAASLLQSLTTNLVKVRYPDRTHTRPSRPHVEAGRYTTSAIHKYAYRAI